jgi:hypothetical protein
VVYAHPASKTPAQELDALIYVLPTQRSITFLQKIKQKKTFCQTPALIFYARNFRNKGVEVGVAGMDEGGGRLFLHADAWIQPFFFFIFLAAGSTF